MHTTLEFSEYQRYQRHIMLPQVGEAGQLRLKQAKVLCVGAGGLASPILAYLTAAGVGTVGIVDADCVDETNLQRQILYTQNDVGFKKIKQAQAHLQALNPYVHIESYDSYLTTDNALTIIEQYDIVIDATDNYHTRYLINDACFYKKKPMIYAGIYQFEGQVSVFSYQNGPCYRCLYPEPPPPGLMQSCAEVGVFGVLPGLLGSIQATEAIKILLNLGESLSERLLTVDTLTMQFQTYPIAKNIHCQLCAKHIPFSELSYHEDPICDTEIVISPLRLYQLMDTKQDIYLLDVRQPEEYQQGHLPHSQLIPLNDLENYIDILPKNKLIVVYCRKDSRSQYACLQLKQYGFKHIKYLEGGILAWQQLDILSLE